MTTARRTLQVAAIAVMAAIPTLAAPSPPAHAEACAGGVPNDFDGDGVRDLVVGDWMWDGDGVNESGAVRVRYTGTGGSATISQDTPGVPGASETLDRFGTDVAGFDVNADGCADLVVSSPYEDLDGEKDAGQIWVIPGAVGGLDVAATKAYHQDSEGYPGSVEAYDYFGFAVEAGNLADGSPYLAVGTPGEQLDDEWGEGVVYYQRGGVTKTFHQNSDGVPGTAEGADYFGDYLAATGDHIVVGVDGETLSGDTSAGMINVFSHTLTAAGLPTSVAGVSQDDASVSGSAEKGDYFGSALSAIPYLPAGATAPGTLVAVGVSGEDLGDFSEAGMAHTLFVGADGRISQVAQYHQDVDGVIGVPEDEDVFGYEVRLVDTGTGAHATPKTAMLALSAPYENNSADDSLGGVHTFRLDTAPGAGDGWVTSGVYGLPAGALAVDSPCFGVSQGGLHVGFPANSALYSVPWGNIRGGGTAAVTTWQPAGGTASEGCAAFI